MFLSHRRGAKPEASTLVSILLVLSVAMTLLFVVAQSSVMHLRFATELENRQHARNLAESAVNEALAKVLTSDEFGKNRAAGQAVRVSGGAYPEGAYGFLSFNQGEAGAEQTWWSTNNLGNAASASGDRRPVPQSTVHLVGVGKCGNVVQTVEVLYYRPPFPKALTASGKIHATAGLAVTGLKAGATYPGSPSTIAPEDRERGSIHANSVDGARSVDLGPDCNISGDVGGCGGVTLDPTVIVGGEVRANGNAQPLPTFDVDALIASVATVTGTDILTASTGALTVNWFAGCNGDLQINGDLTLEEGLLWVKGDLHVTGGIKGRGVVLCKGNVQLDAGATLNAQNVVALAARGDVKLVAADKATYYFQGLIYSEGDILARDITVLGSLIANGGPGKGQMDLENVNAVSTPTTVNSLMMGIPKPALQEKKGLPTLGPWPEGPYVSATPHLDPRTGEKLYDVRIRVFPPKPLFDRTWPNLTYEGCRQLYQDIRDGNPKLVHNESNSDTVMRTQNGAQMANPQYVVNLAINNLLSPADQSRVLLWNSL